MALLWEASLKLSNESEQISAAASEILGTIKREITDLVTGLNGEVEGSHTWTRLATGDPAHARRLIDRALEFERGRECAETLGISESRAARNWRTAKCWLKKELK